MLQVITAVRDSPELAYACLRSLEEQRCTDFTVCVVDDASADDRQRFEEESACLNNDWNFVQNTGRRGPLANQVAAIVLLAGDPDDILVFLDGDDRLAHPDVLAHVEGVYQNNPELLVTYGSYRAEPPSATSAPPQHYPREAWDHARSVRGWSWDHQDIRFNHLRTFRRRLFNEMSIGDWTWPDGSWLMACADTAMMMPALEMAGPDRYAMIDEPLVVYTADQPNSEWKAHTGEVDRVNPYILSVLHPHGVLGA